MDANDFLSLLVKRGANVGPDLNAVRESGVDVQPWERDFGQGVLNPDPLIARRGMGIITEMRDDDALGAYMDMKKSARLCTPFTIKPASDDPEHVTHAEFIADVLERIPGAMKEKLRDILTAMEYGYSITNKPLYVIPEGPFAGRVGIQDLKTKEPQRYRFQLDSFRNVVGLLHENPESFQWEELDAREFIIYTYRREFSNPYGRTDFRRAYRPWNSKKWAWKMWDMYLERFAGGFLDITYAQNKQTPQEHDVMKAFVSDTSTPRTGVLHSDVYDISLNEPTGRGHATFDEAIKSRNIYMARAVLLPDLLGFSQSPGGAFALGKKHFDVFLWVLEDMGQDLEETIMFEQIIKPLINMNYGVPDLYPRFEFDPLTDEQKVFILSQLWEALNTGAITKDPAVETMVREMLGVPALDESLVVEPEPDPEPERDGDEPPVDDDDEEARRNAQQYASFQSAELQRAPVALEVKVNFDDIIFAIETTTPPFEQTWGELLMISRDAIIKSVRENKIIENEDVAAVESLKLVRRLDMEKSLHRFMLDTFLTGALTGQRDVERARRIGIAAASSKRLQTAASQPNVPVNQMFAFFEQQGLDLSPALRRAAGGTIKRQAFFVTGIESEKVLTAAKQVILNGMKRNSVDWTVGRLKKLFDGFVATGDIVDAAVAAPWRVQTIARTQFNNALNEGRRIRFNDPDVRDFIVAYLYSAILDESTTQYCAAMDRRVLTKEEMELEGFPPAHFQCRSVIVPVTEGEQFKLQKVAGGVNRSPGF